MKEERVPTSPGTDCTSSSHPPVGNTLLREIFGSSDSDSASDDEEYNQRPLRCPAQVPSSGLCLATPVPGLFKVEKFLSPADQAVLLKTMEECGWFDDPDQNQALCFGALPLWLESAIAGLPPDLIPPAIGQRRPLFDHMLVNIYQPGEGLRQHLDLLRFEDGILSVSLESACTMTFVHVDTKRADVATDHDDVVGSSGPEGEVDVRLEPGDVLFMHSAARYEWTHGIAARRKDV
eukprot:CAMPEP_0198231558 /NCGR_PEP_ID=MMETSP1445-20131203/115266_1 /TAXON_ID=36898 /ORGANISM="Pyramimonas sp., Strain CCMP2087" /LENGTH=234 /DNA_ID=CAMNT_0043912181 /DNA_START=222 /DNA_END=923 /DNA_ORIENTATION=+